MPIRLTPPAPHQSAPAPSTARVAAGVLLGLQSLLLVGFVGFYIYEMAIGASQDLVRAVMSTILIAIGAVGLGALARAWFRGQSWPRTGSIVWSLLLLPVTVSLVQAGRLGWGLVVGGGALATIAASLAAPPHEP